MPIKFFESIPTEATELKDLEDKFNDFENTEAESIQKLYLTQFTIPENNDEPSRLILWCHYRTKWPNNNSSRSKSSAIIITKSHNNTLMVTERRQKIWTLLTRGLKVAR
jgi:hypothetical protein